MERVDIHPELIRWARERAGMSFEALAARFPKLDAWERGEIKPTLRQLESYAKATRAPLGYFFLPQPPAEPLPIPEFRTLGDAPLRRPSPNLLETLYAMQRRQAWLREERIEQGAAPLAFVSSMNRDTPPAALAEAMRRTLGMGPNWAAAHRTWTEALRALRERSEEVGIMVVSNGVVGNDTNRRLDPNEFRGFVLVDPYAPLIFINGADGKAAQMFTLAHELAHLWVGQNAVFDLCELQPADAGVERLCNQAAAEFLLPEQDMRSAWPEALESDLPYEALARRFKVSELVAARRALDLGLITREQFADLYRRHLETERRDGSGSGGDFYATQRARVGRVFAEAVFRAVREGRLLYREAFELTGLYGAAFDRFMARLNTEAR